MSGYWNSEEWAKIKVDLIMERGSKCQWCGKRSFLVVHHLNYDNYKCEEPSDLVLICKKCHAIEHGKIKVKVKKPKKLSRNKLRKLRKKEREASKTTLQQVKPPPKQPSVRPPCPKCGDKLFIGKSIVGCICGYRQNI